MRSAYRSDRSPGLHACACSSFGAAALALLCVPLSACMSPGQAGQDLGQASEAIQDKNGLDPVSYALSDLQWNGYSTGGLSWDGLETTGLQTGGVATDNTVAWLTWLDNRNDNSIDVMTYLVKCAFPSGTSVSATVNGSRYTWWGSIGLTPGWTRTTGLSTADQEWVSACIGAHVNLKGQHIEFSLRGDNSALATSASEQSTYNCREAAFMGNLWENVPLPLTQCHESTQLTETGRVCDDEDSFECVVTCFAACDPSSGNYASCAANVAGSQRSYQHVITTYLPEDHTIGCLGVGYNVTDHSATYTVSGNDQHWSWGFSYPGVSDTSCNSRCGGYAPSCSCTPDCTSRETCCSDYAELCGSPPDPYATGSISAATSGLSTCPEGYTTHPGSLSSSNTEDTYSFVASTSTQHATLLGGSGTNFTLQLRHLNSDGDSSLLAQSDRGDSNASLHFFYGWPSESYYWQVQRYSGSGNYVLCTSPP